MWRVAFDIGSTFTDFAPAGPDTPPRFLEVASSHDDPARAVIAGCGWIRADAGGAAVGLGTSLHATTVATHAIDMGGTTAKLGAVGDPLEGRVDAACTQLVVPWNPHVRGRRHTFRPS